jgi:hypothetical protein
LIKELLVWIQDGLTIVNLFKTLAHTTNGATSGKKMSANKTPGKKKQGHNVKRLQLVWMRSQ